MRISDWSSDVCSSDLLEGNRVRIVVDGVPLADAYSIGQFASAGRDLVDLEAVERVEIQRGPASTLYGSDALAGVVAFRTLDPQALLLRGAGGRYLGLRLWGTTASMPAAWWRPAGPDAAPPEGRRWDGPRRA